MNKIEIAKEGHSMMKWPSRGWYVSAKGGSHYLSPTLKWQLGVVSPEDCFVRTRREARERLKAWKQKQPSKLYSFDTV
jgi:hypothetical protein